VEAKSSDENAGGLGATEAYEHWKNNGSRCGNETSNPPIGKKERNGGALLTKKLSGERSTHILLISRRGLARKRRDGFYQRKTEAA